MKTINVRKSTLLKIKRFSIISNLKIDQSFGLVLSMVCDDHLPDVIPRLDRGDCNKSIRVCDGDHLRLKLLANDWGVTMTDAADYVIDGWLLGEDE